MARAITKEHKNWKYMIVIGEHYIFLKNIWKYSILAKSYNLINIA